MQSSPTLESAGPICGRPGLPSSGWRGSWALDLLFAFALTIAFFLLLKATPDIPGGDDGYRHVKFASRLIRDPRGVLSQPWKLAYFWPKPVDAWFGYHLLLAPFTLAFDLITAAKALAALIYGAIAFVSLLTLRELGVFCRKAWVVLGVTGSGLFLYRASLARPFLLSILLVLVVTYFTLTDRPWGVAAASAAHALSYSMFFLAALGPAIYLVVRRDKALRIAAASLAGMAAGLVCNPYFPENVRFDLVQAFAPLTFGQKLIMELLPLNMEWISPARPIFAVWLAALGRTVWIWRREKPSTGALLLLGMSLATLAGSIRVARTLDHFIPLAAAYSATVISPWILASRRNRVDAAAAATVLLFFCGLNVVKAHKVVAQAPSANRLRGASEYLIANGQGARVFNTQWEQYPFLYFWNSNNTYITGIDPSFMLFQDARRYWLWRHIANDETATCDRPQCAGADSKAILVTLVEDFEASFVLVEHDKNPRLNHLLQSALPFREVYRDEACSLFTRGNGSPIERTSSNFQEITEKRLVLWGLRQERFRLLTAALAREDCARVFVGAAKLGGDRPMFPSVSSDTPLRLRFRAAYTAAYTGDHFWEEGLYTTVDNPRVGHWPFLSNPLIRNGLMNGRTIADGRHGGGLAETGFLPPAEWAMSPAGSICACDKSHPFV